MKKRFIEIVFSLVLVAVPIIGISQSENIDKGINMIPEKDKAPVESDGLYFTDKSQTNLYTGFYRSYYETGDLELEMFIKEGKPEGPYVVYFRNARIKEVRSYHNGIFNGIWRSYNESGMLKEQAEYLDGKKHGLWMVWDDNGIKRYEMQYSKGKKVGTWYMWDEKGKLISEKSY